MGELLLEELAAVLPSLLGREVTEGGEDFLERARGQLLRVQREPRRERTGPHPRGEVVEGDPGGRLVESQGEQGGGPFLIHVEHLLDSLLDPELLGRGVEDRQRSHGEGGVDALEAGLRLREDSSLRVAGPEIANHPLVGAPPLRVPVGLVLVGVAVASDDLATPGGSSHMPLRMHLQEVAGRPETRSTREERELGRHLLPKLPGGQV